VAKKGGRGRERSRKEGERGEKRGKRRKENTGSTKEGLFDLMWFTATGNVMQCNMLY
jgi:hypothetical protein